jgi:hypothetical protein
MTDLSKVENVVVMTDDYYGIKFPVPKAYISALTATEADKWEVLHSMGIPHDPDKTPLIAWRDAVADLNDVDRATFDPEQGGHLDLGFTDTYIRRFVFYLA